MPCPSRDGPTSSLQQSGLRQISSSRPDLSSSKILKSKLHLPFLSCPALTLKRALVSQPQWSLIYTSATVSFVCWIVFEYVRRNLHGHHGLLYTGYRYYFWFFFLFVSLFMLCFFFVSLLVTPGLLLYPTFFQPVTFVGSQIPIFQKGNSVTFSFTVLANLVFLVFFTIFSFVFVVFFLVLCLSLSL